MNILEEIIEQYPEESFLKADGFDEAIIGVEDKTMRLIYSQQKCISILEKEMGSYADATDYFYFNVLGSYVGEKTPIFSFNPFERWN
jgi:hypothetical protein